MELCMSLLKFALWTVLCTTTVRSQLSVTWNGTTIDTIPPVLIYHDELLVDLELPYSLGDLDRPGALVCRVETLGRAGWRRANGNFFSDGQMSIHQVRTESNDVFPSLSRLTRGVESFTESTEEIFNGLWQCRTQMRAIGIIYVGLYDRGGGGADIDTNLVTISPSSSLSFRSDPPSFTLIGVTVGGPPVENAWTRDGVPISNGGQYNISLVLDEDSAEMYDGIRYSSTMTVTGNFPGVYQYTVSNRATTSPIADSVTIEGFPPSSPMAEQIGLETVSVSWIEPSPPSTGITITVDDTSSTTSVASPHTITGLQPGVHTIRLEAFSQHLTGEAVVEVTVRDIRDPVLNMSSLTATSVTITWTQPEFSLPVDHYTVSLTRVIGSDQEFCPSVNDTVTTTLTATSMEFTDLEEFSIYNVTVIATINAFDFSAMASSSMEFETPSAAPTGVPQDVVFSTTASNVSVSWNTIECIERNGEITDYAVVFQEEGGDVVTGDVINRTFTASGDVITGDVINRTFTASGLTPHTNYIFRVAGVNSNGTGPFSDTTIRIGEEGTNTFVRNVSIAAGLSLFFILLVLLVLCCVCCQCRRKRSGNGKISGENELELTSVNIYKEEPAQTDPMRTVQVSMQGNTHNQALSGSAGKSTPVPIPTQSRESPAVRSDKFTESVQETYDVPTTRYPCGGADRSGIRPFQGDYAYDVPVNSHRTLDSPPNMMKSISAGVLPPRTVPRSLPALPSASVIYQNTS